MVVTVAVGSAASPVPAVRRTAVKAAVAIVVAAALGIAEMGAVDGSVREVPSEEALVGRLAEVVEVSCRRLGVK